MLIDGRQRSRRERSKGVARVVRRGCRCDPGVVVPVHLKHPRDVHFAVCIDRWPVSTPSLRHKSSRSPEAADLKIVAKRSTLPSGLQAHQQLFRPAVELLLITTFDQI